MNKVIITVVGKDNKGIIARVCTYLADNDANILDISQTIVGGYFNMMMIVDLADTASTFDRVQSDLAELGHAMGLEVKCQREEIFEKMHRI